MLPSRPKGDQPEFPEQGDPDDEDMDENYSSATEDEKRAVQAYLLARPMAEVAQPSTQELQQQKASNGTHNDISMEQRPEQYPDEDKFCQPCEPTSSYTERPSQRCNQACEIGIWHQPCPHACRRAARHLGCHDCLHHAVTSDLAATARYANIPPDCDVAPLKRQRFRDWPRQYPASQHLDNEATYANADVDLH